MGIPFKRSTSRVSKGPVTLSKLEQSEVLGDTIRGGKRERQYFNYTFAGQSVCEKAWRYIHSIGEKRFKNIKSHYKMYGVVPRNHGLKGKRPANAYSFEVIQDVVQFLIRYGEENGFPNAGSTTWKGWEGPRALYTYLQASLRWMCTTSMLKRVETVNLLENVLVRLYSGTFGNHVSPIYRRWNHVLMYAQSVNNIEIVLGLLLLKMIN
ncbi:uncharacterized protein LOC144452366 [Glandiceps talaboti]